MRVRLILAAALAASAAAAASFVWLRPTVRPERDAGVPVVRPTLYCEFYNFTHNATVVSFNFEVGRDAGGTSTFAELFVVEPDGSKVELDDKPQWTSGVEDGSPVIVSPDTATRIVLYGLKSGAPGVFWTEAGVRSNVYRNLEGKCRQAYLDMVTPKTR